MEAGRLKMGMEAGGVKMGNGVGWDYDGEWKRLASRWEMNVGGIRVRSEGEWGQDG